MKVCGLTTADDVRCGRAATFAGFVFAPGSPRHLTAEKAAPLAGLARFFGTKPVGVFRNAPRPVVADLATLLDLDAVQLHGERGRRICARSSPPVAAVVRDLDCRECRRRANATARRRPRPVRQRQRRHRPHVRLGRWSRARSRPAAVDCRRRDRTRATRARRGSSAPMRSTSARASTRCPAGSRQRRCAPCSRPCVRRAARKLRACA